MVDKNRQIGSFPQMRVENKQCLKFHHLDNISPNLACYTKVISLVWASDYTPGRAQIALSIPTPRSLTASLPLKNDGWKATFLLGGYLIKKLGWDFFWRMDGRNIMTFSCTTHRQSNSAAKIKHERLVQGGSNHQLGFRWINTNPWHLP